jgi:hypothetical protein
MHHPANQPIDYQLTKDPMDLSQLLINLGLNVASNAIYDIVRFALRRSPEVTHDSLQKELAAFLRVDGADIKAETIITFLAQRGDIVITGSRIYATEKIEMGSAPGTKFVFGNNSSSSTSKSSIQAGHGAFIQGQGGAKIVQNSDGISFYT